MSSLAKNPKLLCAFHGLQMSLFPMAVITVFFKQDIGMTLGQIMLLQGAFGLAMVLFEFPSGYLADRIGYRRTMILASLMNIVGWSMYVRADSIPWVLAAEVVLGVGLSLISGTDSALMYESLLETNDEASFGHWSGRMRFFGQFGEGTAALVAGLLYATWHRLPFALEVAVWVVNLFVAWRLVEPARHRPPATDNLKQIRAMVHRVWIGDPSLRAVTLIVIAFGMSSFVPVWTIQLYAVEEGMPEAWLGVLWAVANYTVALGSLQSARASSRLGLGRLLVLCIGLMAIGYLGMGLVPTMFGALFYLVLTTMRGLNVPVLHHEEQRRIPSSDRAGFISLRSLTFRGLFLILGPIVGFAMDDHGQRPVLLALGAMFVGAALFALALVRREGVLDPVDERAS